MRFADAKDPRYEFEVLWASGAVRVEQRGVPPGRPPVWENCVWAQWAKSKTTDERCASLARRLREADPSTKWFRGRVRWTYP